MTANGIASDYAIDILNVSKTYKGRVRALQDVAMRVERGEVFGLLGPNGAGKSTLVKILMTVIRASKVHGTMLGSKVGSKAALSRVGYLPEHHRFPEYLTGAQVLDYYASLAGVPRKLRQKRIGMLLDLVDMTDWAKTRVKGYSKGMRQRIGIAQSLMNNPYLVLLDEPTDGVDPQGRREIRKILQRLKAQGTTVFLNSHLLSELEMVCDRVSILVQGRVSMQGTIDELTHDQRRYEIHLIVPQSMSESTNRVAESIPASLERLPDEPNALEDTRMHELTGGRPTHTGRLVSGEEVEVREGRVSIKTQDAERIQSTVDQLRQNGIIITAIKPVRPSLEDLFMAAITDTSTGEKLHAGAERGKKRKPAKAPPPEAPAEEAQEQASDENQAEEAEAVTNG